MVTGLLSPFSSFGPDKPIVILLNQNSKPFCIKASPFAKRDIRFVAHLDFTDEMLEETVGCLVKSIYGINLFKLECKS
jgi:hypothetical protein